MGGLAAVTEALSWTLISGLVSCNITRKVHPQSRDRDLDLKRGMSTTTEASRSHIQTCTETRDRATAHRVTAADTHTQIYRQRVRKGCLGQEEGGGEGTGNMGVNMRMMSP